MRSLFSPWLPLRRRLSAVAFGEGGSAERAGARTSEPVRAARCNRNNVPLRRTLHKAGFKPDASI